MWCIKYIPSRGHYYHAFLDCTQKKSAKVRLYCWRGIICSDHWSGDSMWHKDIFNIKYCPLNELFYVKNGVLKIPTTCLMGRTMEEPVEEAWFNGTVDKKKSLECEDDGREQKPWCKGQISPAERPPPHSGGNVMVELQCFRPQYELKNIREAKI